MNHYYYPNYQSLLQKIYYVQIFVYNRTKILLGLLVSIINKS